MSDQHFASGASRTRFAVCPPRAIVFETAGVLYDATPRRRWLWQLVTRLGLRVTYDEFIRPWDVDFLPAVHRGERPYADAMHAFLASLGFSSADSGELEAAAFPRCQPLETGVRPLPAVIRILNRLSAEGLMTAVLSDCSLPGNEVKEQLDVLGLGGRFGVVITSVDLGHVKPDRDNYLAMQTALGVQSHECAIVSSRADDLAGARACEWRTIGCGDFAAAQVDAAIPSIDQLAEVVSQWMRGKLRVAS